MTKLTDVIGNMSQEELMALKSELDTGHINRFVSDKIQEKAVLNAGRICPVCHTEVDDECITLIFGPRDLRKKASFCAADCLEYFLKSKIKMEEQNERRN